LSSRQILRAANVPAWKIYFVAAISSLLVCGFIEVPYAMSTQPGNGGATPCDADFAVGSGNVGLASERPPAIGPRLAPPPTRTDSVNETYHNVAVADPYRWLEVAADPEVQAWNSTQKVLSRGYLDALPTNAAITAELVRLQSATSPSWSQVDAHGSVIFALYNDPKLQQPMLVTVNATADPASWKVVLDPNARDASTQSGSVSRQHRSP
jgi:hypothetical protein